VAARARAALASVREAFQAEIARPASRPAGV
jgi:hypothetical protein